MFRVITFGVLIVVVALYTTSEMTVQEMDDVAGAGGCTHYLNAIQCPNNQFTIDCHTLNRKQRDWACFVENDVVPVSEPNCDTELDPGGTKILCSSRTTDKADKTWCQKRMSYQPF